MKKRTLLAVCMLALGAVVAFAFVSGFSNLYGPYPSFSSKAMRPHKPFSKDKWALDSYRRDVEQYVEDANNYIRAASNDIDSINDAMRDARNEANQVVSEYNNYVTYGF